VVVKIWQCQKKATSSKQCKSGCGQNLAVSEEGPLAKYRLGGGYLGFSFDEDRSEVRKLI